MFVFMSLLLLTALLSCSSSKPICSKTRKEIAERTGLNPNGDFTKMLKALMGSDFVVKYTPFGFSQREEHYKLIDSFCWFWLHFKEKKAVKQNDYWQQHLKESDVASWRGIAFEEVCLQHISQIKLR